MGLILSDQVKNGLQHCCQITQILLSGKIMLTRPAEQNQKEGYDEEKIMLLRPAEKIQYIAGHNAGSDHAYTTSRAD